MLPSQNPSGIASYGQAVRSEIPKTGEAAMRPATIAQNFHALPIELRVLPNWLVWEYRLIRGKWEKVPLIADGSGHFAKSNDPSTWRTFEEAVKFIPGDVGVGGIACCVVEPWCFIDLDCCRQPETGEITPWARRIIEFFASYTEISPSGTGLHILVKLRGKLPEGDRIHGSKKSGWEIGIFDVTSPRYFCSTGVVFEGRDAVCTVDPASFYGEFSGGAWDVVKAPATSGRAKSRTASESDANGPLDKWARLKRGEWEPFYPSQSEADMALVGYFAGQFHSDPVLIDQAFRKSGLMRPKWDEARPGGTYGSLTIAKVIQDESREDGLNAADGLDGIREEGMARVFDEGYGASLLQEIERLLAEFLVLLKGGYFVLALFSIATHCFRLFNKFPYLVMLSPTKGCGKTRVAEVLEGPAVNVIRTTGNISEAALFRLIAERGPCLVLDEAETLSAKGERADFLRSLLNGGNRADTVVYRCIGGNHELQQFPIYCPKVVCAIRVCPDTIKDRGIVFSMQKKLRSQPVARYIARRFKTRCDPMRQRIAEFVKAHEKQILATYESLELDFLSDRDTENWMPLFAMLGVLAPERFNELREIAERLTGQKAEDDEDDSLNLKLLSDIRSELRVGETVVLTTELLERLRGREDSPWRKEFELDPRRLARMMRPFGVVPRQVRAKDGRAGKGYRRDLFEPVFLAYLDPEAEQAKQDNVYAGETQFSQAKQEPTVSDEKNAEQSMFMRVVSHVSDAGSTREEETTKNGSATSVDEGGEGPPAPDLAVNTERRNPDNEWGDL